ncbi:cytochrome P450 [Streptomyces sp. NPDC020875]|uniref:cytochrome P450 n=1 Tax=Streptomyces sp. NPDC020875 TaxID=3154898 RepID=UPI0033C737C1
MSGPVPDDDLGGAEPLDAGMCPYAATGRGDAASADRGPADGRSAAGGRGYTLAKAPGAWPVLGHAGRLLRDPLAFMESLPSVGDLVQIGVGPLTVTVVCHPDLAHHVMLDDRTFDKGGFVWDRMREVVGDGVSTVGRDKHRRQRRMLQPAFRPQAVRAYAAVMSEQVTTMTAKWRDGDILDVHPETVALSTRIVTRTMFSTSLDEGTLTEVRETVEEIVRSGCRLMLVPPSLDRLPTPFRRRFNRANARFREITTGLVRSCRETGINHGDVLSHLLSGRDRHGRPLTDTEICDQVSSVFLAGVETTATVIGWALHLMTRHPDVQRQVHEEVTAVLQGRDPTWEDLPRLVYTRAVVYETLRYRTPVWLTTRVTTADTLLGGHRMAAGGVVVLSPHLMHCRLGRDGGIGRFDPKRWVDTAMNPHVAVHQTDTWQPFGMGPRRCIGDTYGLTEATLALASITARWHLAPAPGSGVRTDVKALVTPADLRIHLTRRPEGPPEVTVWPAP